jgi:hypothetical protein
MQPDPARFPRQSPKIHLNQLSNLELPAKLPAIF